MKKTSLSLTLPMGPGVDTVNEVVVRGDGRSSPVGTAAIPAGAHHMW